MPDVLIRNFPAEDLALLDEHAARYGISRAEYLRRQLHQEARRSIISVTAADLVAFAEAIPDLADNDVTTDAWT
ncbi:MAG TPA: antitoxin [Actinomycetales bacterium]|jgi:hypothetical protein|nr:antitoxin [Actinomycetales bacterium]